MNTINETHEKEFGRQPEVVYKVPGRFHLMGEHSGFFKDKTMSMSINRFVHIAVSPRDDDSFYFYFEQADDRKHITLEAFKFRKDDKWANAIKSVIYGFTANGFEIHGMDFTVRADVMPSAGLGITTAMKVGAAFSINDLFDFDCSDNEILAVLEKGNREFLKGENLLADNFTAIYAKEQSVIVTNHEDLSFDNIPFSFEDKTVFLVDTRVPRIDIWDERSLYDERNALVLGDLKVPKSTAYGGWVYTDERAEVSEIFSVFSENIRRRLNGIINEHECVLEAVDALRKQAFAPFAKAVNKSHENLRDCYGISCPEIDWILKRLVEINPTPDASFNPVCCGRITGKGYGRCLYAILDAKNLPEFKKRLSEFTKIFGFRTSCYDVRAANGAQRVP